MSQSINSDKLPRQAAGKNLYDARSGELAAFLTAGGFPAYRIKQVEEWLSRGVSDPELMSNLPKPLREALKTHFRQEQAELIERFVSREDETAKYVFRLADGNVVESVYMVYRHGTSVCISSQAGCKMGCTFCASAKAGFGRDLTAGEMLEQVAAISRDQGRRINSVVVMGIGEPLENYEELMKFLDLVNDPEGLNIGRRHLTVSTCGIIPRMLQFAEEAGQVTLAVSLHAPNQELREKLMPIARVHKLDSLMAACRFYQEHSSRRLTFEYALLAGVNDSPVHASELAALVRGLRCHVNLIPANEFPGGAYRRSGREAQQTFQAILEKHSIPCTIRRELGKDIMAACGQLRRRVEDE